MSDPQPRDDKSVPNSTIQQPAQGQPEEKSSSWILILWILLPILFLIGITIWRSN